MDEDFKVHIIAKYTKINETGGAAIYTLKRICVER